MRRDDTCGSTCPGPRSRRGRIVLTTDGLRLRTGRAIDLDLRGPERVAVSGPNGSGKTTLLAGLLPPVAGTADAGACRCACSPNDSTCWTRP